MLILDGKKTREDLELQMKDIIYYQTKQGERNPRLVVIQLGDYEESTRYVKNKEVACNRVGITFNKIDVSSECTEENLVTLIEGLNKDDTVDGVIVQLPIKSINYINVRKVLDTISPEKDVDGLTTTNFGKLLTGEFITHNGFAPCTALGVISLLQRVQPLKELKGKNVLIIGKGLTSGRPLVPMFMYHGANVTNISSGCHQVDRQNFINRADVVISCVGSHIIDPIHLKHDCILINVGMRTESNKLKGDYDLDDIIRWYNLSYTNKPKAVTTIVGSTGILTVTYLLWNTCQAYLKR